MVNAALASGDLELDFLKQRYQQDFKEAFILALRGLTVRERNLLRQRFIYGLSLDELGALYRVNRATTARWVVQAREEVLADIFAQVLGLERVGVAFSFSILET